MYELIGLFIINIIVKFIMQISVLTIVMIGLLYIFVEILGYKKLIIRKAQKKGVETS